MLSKCFGVVLDMEGDRYMFAFKYFPVYLLYFFSIHCAKTAVDNSKRPPGVKRFMLPFLLIQLLDKDIKFHLHGWTIL